MSSRYRLSRREPILAEHKRARTIDAGPLPQITNYLAFFALNFAHLARCAAAILARAAADSLWGPRLPPPDFPATILNASIALSNFARSAFNCATTALKSAISCSLSYRREDLTASSIIPKEQYYQRV
jgi:hypothetical protein